MTAPGAPRECSSLDAHLDILERVFSRAVARAGGPGVTPTVHILTGEYPPQCGGVGDYTRLVADALTAGGFAVHVWCPAVTDGVTDGVTLHRLPDVFGHGSRQLLEAALAASPGTVLLQYVPNALGARGANLPFCLWLRRMRGRGTDVRVMFHEPYFYFSWRHPLGNVLALLQRVMAAVLLRASNVVYLSTETWVRYLRPLAPPQTPMVVAPMPSTVPSAADPRDVSRWRARHEGQDGDAAIVGHFGTYRRPRGARARSRRPRRPLLAREGAVHLHRTGQRRVRGEALPAESVARQTHRRHRRHLAR